MHRLLLVPFLLVALLPSAGYTQTTSTHYALGYVRDRSADPGKDAFCTDARLVTSEKREVPLAESGPAKESFVMGFKAQFSGGVYSEARADLVPPGQALLVYEYRKYFAGYNCSPLRIDHIKADDMETARSRLDSWKQDCADACSAWHVHVEWPHESNYVVYTQVIEGLQITVQEATLASGKRVGHLRVKNTLADKAKTLMVVERTGLSSGLEGGKGLVEVRHSVVIQPGGGFSGPLHAAGEFGFAVGDIALTAPEAPGVIDRMREGTEYLLHEGIPRVQEWFSFPGTTPDPKPSTPNQVNETGVRG